MILKSNPEVESLLLSYPEMVQEKLFNLRRLILESAGELDDVTELEETLKWGEPSYLNKIGSTIRIDWKKKKPDQYAIYFKCTSKLVPTFRAVFSDQFNYEKNRAILFKLEDKIPEEKIKKCIKAALMYHKVKQIKNLGIT